MILMKIRRFQLNKKSQGQRKPASERIIRRCFQVGIMEVSICLSFMNFTTYIVGAGPSPVFDPSW